MDKIGKYTIRAVQCKGEYYEECAIENANMYTLYEVDNGLLSVLEDYPSLEKAMEGAMDIADSHTCISLWTESEKPLAFLDKAGEVVSEGSAVTILLKDFGSLRRD